MKDNPASKQVGGSHYQTKGVQHVQFCQHNRIPWCEAAAIKYLIRHRLKNGKQDLEKAKHYLEFCCFEDYLVRKECPTDMDPKKFTIPVAKFLKDNAVPKEEGEIVEMVLSHQVLLGEGTLLQAIKRIDKLIKTYGKEEDFSSLLD